MSFKHGSLAILSKSKWRLGKTKLPRIFFWDRKTFSVGKDEDKRWPMLLRANIRDQRMRSKKWQHFVHFYSTTNDRSGKYWKKRRPKGLNRLARFVVVVDAVADVDDVVVVVGVSRNHDETLTVVFVANGLSSRLNQSIGSKSSSSSLSSLSSLPSSSQLVAVRKNEDGWCASSGPFRRSKHKCFCFFNIGMRPTFLKLKDQNNYQSS